MAAKDSAPAAINKRAGEVQRNLKNRRWRGVRARQQTERIQSCLHLTKSIPDVSIDAKQGVFFSTPLSRDLGYKFVNLYRHLRFYFDTASERVCLPMLFCTLGTRFCWKALFILVTTKLSGKILVMSYPSLYCYSTLPDATRCDNSRQTCRSLMCNNETEPKTRLCFSSFGSALNGIFSNTRV